MEQSIAYIDMNGEELQKAIANAPHWDQMRKLFSLGMEQRNAAEAEITTKVEASRLPSRELLEEHGAFAVIHAKFYKMYAYGDFNEAA